MASTFKPVTELNENRQTQCNICMEDVRGKQDGACVSKFTNEPEVWPCTVQLQFKAPDQIIHCQDYNYWNQRKFPNPCNAHVTHKLYKCCRQAENINASEISRHVPSFTNVCSSKFEKIRYCKSDISTTKNYL